MKLLRDEQPFRPVTIILETPRELEMMEQACRRYKNDHAKGPVEIEFYDRTSAWLCKEAHP